MSEAVVDETRRLSEHLWSSCKLAVCCPGVREFLSGSCVYAVVRLMFLYRIIVLSGACRTVQNQTRGGKMG